MATGAITKTGTLAMTFHKPAGEANPYVWFGYSPLTIFNHTRGQVSLSMNSNTINMIHTSQKSTKEGLNEELEGCFISSKLKLQRTIIYKLIIKEIIITCIVLNVVLEMNNNQKQCKNNERLV